MSKQEKRIPTMQLVLCAVFAALTAVCAQITIPIGTVPISLSLLPPLLCAALLRPRYAVLSMAVYLLMGLCGLPVFSGMSGGPGKLFGVTGGYILGYIPCVLLASILIHRAWDSIILKCTAMALGVIVCYVFGTVWFMVIRGTDLMSTLSICVFPFLPFDALKILLAAFLSDRLEKPLEKAAGITH